MGDERTLDQDFLFRLSRKLLTCFMRIEANTLLHASTMPLSPHPIARKARSASSAALSLSYPRKTP